jgi:hypothetical protein
MSQANESLTKCLQQQSKSATNDRKNTSHPRGVSSTGELCWAACLCDRSHSTSHSTAHSASHWTTRSTSTSTSTSTSNCNGGHGHADNDGFGLVGAGCARWNSNGGPRDHYVGGRGGWAARLDHNGRCCGNGHRVVLAYEMLVQVIWSGMA